MRALGLCTADLILGEFRVLYEVTLLHLYGETEFRMYDEDCLSPESPSSGNKPDLATAFLT